MLCLRAVNSRLGGTSDLVNWRGLGSVCQSREHRVSNYTHTHTHTHTPQWGKTQDWENHCRKYHQTDCKQEKFHIISYYTAQATVCKHSHMNVGTYNILDNSLSLSHVESHRGSSIG